MRCPDKDAAEKMIALVEEVKANGDSVGGKITCAITGVPVGLGEPVYDRLNADLADAMASAHNGVLDAPVQAALKTSLQLDPDQPKALALAGTAALRSLGCAQPDERRTGGTKCALLRYWGG